MTHFVYGMDISSLPSLIKQGLKAFKNEEEVLDVLKDSGVNTIRLRLYVDPFTREGLPYGGGQNDLASTVAFAKKIRDKGLDILLDFHYSDFWADPGKQTLPKAWEGQNFDTLTQQIYDYTREVLMTFKQNSIVIKYIQTGNEITNGMMWPAAKLYEKDTKIAGGFTRLGRLLKAAKDAIDEVMPHVETIIHLDRGGDKALYQDWFTHINNTGLAYDVIGLSYYPYWHGSLKDLKENIENIRINFAKKVMVMETAYAYKDEIKDAPLVMNTQQLNTQDGWPPYPFTQKGQLDFMKDLLTMLFDLKVEGLFYWEPAWLYVKGDTWATKEGREYIKETDKKDGNEWANQALFDEDGQPNPALAVYQDIKGEKR